MIKDHLGLGWADSCAISQTVTCLLGSESKD